jgi:hypothetical protein
MPYIKQEDRDYIDPHIESLVDRMQSMFSDVGSLPGPTNYAITRIVAGVLKPHSGWSYHSLSRAIAVFHDAATEMERRLMAEYEDRKIIENGDLEEYK